MTEHASPSQGTLSRRRALALGLGVALWLAIGVATAAEVDIDVRITNGRVPENLQRIRVTEGDAVRLRFTVDRPMTLHLHGYDIERRVVPGTVGEIAFAARATGRFPLHAHGDAAHDETALLYVEVYPR
jgi:FtsP/CotA-like multicopper oxidase with cupredoxin domain